MHAPPEAYSRFYESQHQHPQQRCYQPLRANLKIDSIRNITTNSNDETSCCEKIRNRDNTTSKNNSSRLTSCCELSEAYEKAGSMGRASNPPPAPPATDMFTNSHESRDFLKRTSLYPEASSAGLSSKYGANLWHFQRKSVRRVKQATEDRHSCFEGACLTR